MTRYMHAVITLRPERQDGRSQPLKPGYILNLLHIRNASEKNQTLVDWKARRNDYHLTVLHFKWVDDRVSGAAGLA